MSQCVINGISISFPFEPYKVQEDYMDKVITCLKQVNRCRNLQSRYSLSENILTGTFSANSTV